jgi:tetratricopeptide (TPR) repeat protein
MENGQFVKASETFDKAITIDPDFALAHIYQAITNVGGFNVQRTNIDAALKNIDNVTTGERDLILLSAASIDHNQLKQKVYLDRLMTYFPNDKRVQMWAANYYYNVGDYKTCRNHIESAIKIDSRFAPAYNSLGYTEWKLGNNTQSEEAIKKYISLLPENPNPYDSYGEILLNIGKYDESIKQYNIALTKDPTFTNAMIGIGNNFTFKGNFETARKWYQQCFDNTTDVELKLIALTLTAASYIHEGNTALAIAALNKRIDFAIDNNLTTEMITTYNSECLILTEAGRVTEGLQMLDTATKTLESSILPNETKQTLLLQTNLNRCYALIANNSLDEAKQRMRMLIQTVNSRDNISEIQQLNTNLAMLELKQGDFNKAISYFEKSNLNSELNQYYMGVAYSKLGNTIKAGELFSKVKNSRNNNINLAVVKSRATE